MLAVSGRVVPSTTDMVELPHKGVAAAERPLVEGDGPRQPGLERRRGLEQVLSVQRVAHLEPEDVAGREPARRAVHPRNFLQQRPPQVDGDVFVREQLVADLTGVAGSRDDHGPPPERRLGAPHELEPRGLREQRLDDRGRPRSLHREEAPVLVIHQVDPFGGLGVRQDLQHPLGVGGVRHDEVPRRFQAVHDQILDDPAALVQHEVVLRLAHLDGGDVVADDTLQQCQRAGPRHLDLAEVREVE